MSQLARNWLILLGVVALAAVVGQWMQRTGAGEAITATPQVRSSLPGGVAISTVQVACERAVRDRLVSPSTMRVAGRTNPIPVGTTIRHVLDVDSQNAFGAMLRSEWLCVYEDDRVTQIEQQR